jgi:hypothetical protein
MFGSQVLANGPTVGRDAGGIVPLQNTQVQLIAEEVTIELPGSDILEGRVHCRYSLKNLSDRDQQFDMGFVVPSTYFKRFHLYRSPDFRVKVFSESFRRQACNVRYESVDRGKWADFFDRNVPDSLPVWQITMSPGAMVFVDIDYKIGWSVAGPWYSFTYHTRSAALWEGPITSAKVLVTFGDLMNAMVRAGERDSVVSWAIEPANYVWTDRGIEWTFEDWEPTSDIRIKATLPEEGTVPRSN